MGEIGVRELKSKAGEARLWELVASGREEGSEIDWPSFEVVEVDASLAEHAAELAFTDELRSLDALHFEEVYERPNRTESSAIEAKTSAPARSSRSPLSPGP